MKLLKKFLLLASVYLIGCGGCSVHQSNVNDTIGIGQTHQGGIIINLIINTRQHVLYFTYIKTATLDILKVNNMALLLRQVINQNLQFGVGMILKFQQPTGLL